MQYKAQQSQLPKLIEPTTPDIRCRRVEKIFSDAWKVLKTGACAIRL